MARLLLDENLPRRLATHFADHTARTVRQMQWGGVRNGALLRRAQEQFDVFITADRSIQFQQSVSRLNIGVVVIESRSIRYTDLVPLMPLILSALERTRAGEVSVVSDQSRGPAEVGQGR